MSFTQISLYQRCPLLYKLQYVDGFKPAPRGYFSFGSTMHHCLEYFYKVSTPPAPPLAKLLEVYDRNWLSAGYTSAEEEEGYRELGREILTRFWETHHKAFRLPLALEKMFYIDIDGVKLRGFIDRADKLDSGGIEIVDYKTSRELYTNDSLANDLQLTIYQLAAEQMWSLPVERLTLYHLRSNTACSCPPRGPAPLAAARQLIREVADNIAGQRFLPRESAFCPCEFPRECPHYRHQYLTEAPETSAGRDARESVEEYARLHGEIKEREKRLGEIREELIRFCEEGSLNRVFGSEHCIDYSMVERSGFVEDAVRELLEPMGLWARVLRLDPSLIKEMLADEEIPPQVRENLAALRRVLSSYPSLRLKKHPGEEETE
ncbi:MAG: PD-(D/E)XK nuclease family protein [Chloroflexota bacterium]